MRILHIISGLGDGGAENSLYKVCKNDLKNQHMVISITSSGKYYSILKDMGIEVYCLNLKYYSFIQFFILIKLIRSLKPDILQTWLIMGDFLGGIAGRLAGVSNIVWNIHFSYLKKGLTSFRNLIIIKILSILSYHVPNSIIVISNAGITNCINLGYCKKKLILIPNGYELSDFNYDKLKKNRFRKKLKINNNIPILGMVSRYDPAKDHITLIRALSILHSKKVSFICVMVGQNIDYNNKVLTDVIHKLDLNKKIILLGVRSDIPEVMNGIDIHILSSKSEAFPNVVAEAMACKTPCICTNVGDCSFIIGNTGWIVPPKKSKELAKGIEIALSELGSQKWDERINHARLRIKEKFDINQMIESLNNLWIKILKNEI